MSRRRFLYCLDCNAVHHVTPFDKAPVFEIDGGQVREIPQDDRRDFIDRHSGHTIGELVSVGDNRGERGQIIDPMGVNYFEVTDGRASYVLRSFRRSIADPLTYEVLPRQMMLWRKATGSGLSIDLFTLAGATNCSNDKRLSCKLYRLNPFDM